MSKINRYTAAKWFLLALASGAFLYVLYLRRNLCFSFAADLEGTEAFQVILLQFTRLFGSPYSDISRPPCLAVPYAPFYYEFVNLFIKRMQVDVTGDVHRVYTMARQLSLLANLANVALIYLIGRQLGQRHWVSGCAAAIFFLWLTFHNYAVRPDSLKLLVICVSLFFFLRAIANSKFRSFNFFMAGSLVTASVLLKQDAIQVLIGFLAYMFFVQKQWRPMIRWFTLGCCITLLFAVPYLILKGIDLTIMLTSITQGVGTGFEWSMYLFLIITHYYLPFCPVIILSGYLIYRYRKSGKRNETADLLVTLFICMGVFSSLFALRMGAAPLYFMEFNVIMILLILVLMEGVKMKRLVYFFTVVFIVLKLIEITRFARANLDETLEQEFMETEKAARALSVQLPLDDKVFAFDGLMNTFLTDRLAASNLGYELFTYAFYRKDIRLQVKDYKAASTCKPDGIILLDDSISENYMETYHPGMRITLRNGKYAVYSTPD